MPIWAAMILSSVLFGIMHAYQGLSGILRTAGLGLLMAGLFVASGNLLWAIVGHVVIDAYAGALSWIAPGSASRAADADGAPRKNPISEAGEREQVSG
jgi:membrane protease YdiL (CAAX protease family)